MADRKNNISPSPEQAVASVGHVSCVLRDMTKRKCELQSLVTVLPPCKKPLPSKRCTPDVVQIFPVRKRKLEPESAPPEEECERVLPPFPATTSSPPPCKKMRGAENSHSQELQYKCQNDEAFPEYNSFQYWRTPLPDIDFSELSDTLCGAATSEIQEMDS
ncbi:unnamed protein product [Staurois parvus]|uniref:Putative WW-binding domain-containing protein n=1 Tax=Staurois parvus TaxID=386267 RepID=A0ABN9ANW1_9NEOB|nr:unnamed protein product [Staurois parvus]